MKDNWEWKDYLQLREMRPNLFTPSTLIDIVLDETTVEHYERETGKRIGVVYQSAYNTLLVDLIRGKDGQYYTYERIVPTVEKGAVVVVPCCHGKYVLLEQFRHAMRQSQIAFPRGYGEAGYSAEENAKKELLEELAAPVLAITHLGQVIADSGLCGNYVDVFLCEISSYSIKQEYEGIVNVVELTEQELKKWIVEGKITDGYTLSAYGIICSRMNLK